MADYSVKDKYGKALGSVEQRGDNYILRDKNGFKSGTAEKEFLSDNFNVYDQHGQKVGKVEKNIIGSGATVKNSRGTTIGSITPSFNGGVFVWIFFVIAIVLVFSFKSIPETLQSAFTDWRFNNVPFWAVCLPICLFSLAGVSVCIGMKTGKNTFGLVAGINSFGTAFLMMCILGAVVYIGFIWLICIIAMFIDGFWDSLLAMVLVPLIHVAPYLTLAIPLSLIFSIILACLLKSRKS